MHEVMSKFVKQYQCIIESKQVKAVGKGGLRDSTNKLMEEFFDDICKTVLNADDEAFVVQWAIIKLSEEERHAAKAGKEEHRG